MSSRFRYFIATVSILAVFALMAAPAAAHCGKCGVGDEDHTHAEKAEIKADIIQTAVAAGSFETLVAAVKAAGLVDALKGEGPFTVFAPTDEAFAALPEGTVATLLKPENKEKLVSILTYHVVKGEVPSKVAVTLKKGETLNGQSFAVKYDGKVLKIDNAKVVKADIKATNGIIHVIDTVLIPAEKVEASR